MALFFSILGDYFGSCGIFLAQMGSFAVGHIFYIIFFLRRFHRKVEPDRKMTAKAKGYFQMSQDKRHEYFDLFAQEGVNAVYAGHHHSTHAGEYKGVTMKTLTAVGVQLGPDKSAFRVITVENGAVSDEIVELK